MSFVDIPFVFAHENGAALEERAVYKLMSILANG